MKKTMIECFRLIHPLLADGRSLSEALFILSEGGDRHSGRGRGETYTACRDLLKLLSAGIPLTAAVDRLWPDAGALTLARLTGICGSASLKEGIDSILADSDRRSQLKKHLAAAAAYPALLASALCAASVWMFLYGLPALRATGLTALPGTEELVVSVIPRSLTVLASAAALCLLCCRLVRRRREEAELWQLLNSLEKSGFTLSEAAQLCRTQHWGFEAGSGIEAFHRALIQGRSASEALMHLPGTRKWQHELLALSSSGQVRPLLARAARRGQQRLENLYSGIERMAEPAFLLLCGILMLGFATGIVIPLISGIGGSI